MAHISPSQRRRHPFSLIEIVIALGVMSIGIVAIMGVIPMGLNASRDAIADNYSADSANQLLHYLSQSVRSDWTTRINALPDEPPNISTAAGPYNVAPWTLMTGTGNMYEDGTVYTGDVYRIVQKTDRPAPYSDTIVDFDAIVRVWKTPTIGWEYDPAGPPYWPEAKDDTYNKRALLNLEISWPSAIPFNGRRKSYYAIEVSKP
jgi:type II secretory pathway pseudopilin PulG